MKLHNLIPLDRRSGTISADLLLTMVFRAHELKSISQE